VLGVPGWSPPRAGTRDGGTFSRQRPQSLVTVARASREWVARPYFPGRASTVNTHEQSGFVQIRWRWSSTGQSSPWLPQSSSSWSDRHLGHVGGCTNPTVVPRQGV